MYSLAHCLHTRAAMPSYHRRPSVCPAECMRPCDRTRCGRTLCRTALVLGWFERSISLVCGGLKCLRFHVTFRPYIYLSPRRGDLPDENRAFSLFFVDVCENHAIILQGTRTSGMGISTTRKHNLPQITPSSHQGVKKMKKKLKILFSTFKW